MKIKFIDKNQSLVNKVRKATLHLPFRAEVLCDDIFNYEGVIVSASNPDFTMGAGLDALIAEKYPEEVKQARKNPNKNQRIGNVIFTITVNEDLKATKSRVIKALKFALFNVKENETALISGLGTGIGGLDEDEFVWIFLKSICEKFGFGWGIKFVRKDSKDFYTGKIKYKVGSWLEQEDTPRNDEACDVGLHLGKSFIGAGNYNLPERILFCMFSKKDLCGQDNDKVRVSKLKVLCELPRWLGYGTNGKKFVSKIGRKIDFEKYNPYQSTKLPPVNKLKKFLDQAGTQVKDQVRDQIWAQVWDQVGDQVGDQVWAQVRTQVRAQIWDQVGNQVGDQVWDQVRDQVWAQVWDQARTQVGDQAGDQVGDQVWAQPGTQVKDQVWTTSYWAVNSYFDLGLSHWFGKFLKLGVMVIFVEGKLKIFGKKGKFLGEYDEKEFKTNNK